jgi:hypothetical protein
MPIRARIMLVKRDHESCDGKRGRIVAAVHDRLVRMTDGDGAVCLTRSSPVETNVGLPIDRRRALGCARFVYSLAGGG